MYSLNGDLLNKFESTKLAAKETKFNENSIVRAIKLAKKYNGYLWKRN